MKQFLWICLGWLALLVTAHAANASKTQPSESGEVIVQSFNLEELSAIEEHGYEISNGQRLKGDELWSQQYCVINRDNFPARPVKLVRCVLVIQTMLGRDANDHPVWKNNDAIQINFNGNDLDIFDSGDTYCSSSLYPNRSVFAIGLWKERKRPQVGGYAYTLRNAWVVDPETRRLKKIHTNSVKCEINEDRD